MARSPTNSIERLPQALHRRIKTQGIRLRADTASMMTCALPASAPLTLRKIDGQRTLAGHADGLRSAK